MLEGEEFNLWRFSVLLILLANDNLLSRAPCYGCTAGSRGGDIFVLNGDEKCHDRKFELGMDLSHVCVGVCDVSCPGTQFH